MKFKKLYIRLHPSDLESAVSRYHFEGQETMFLQLYEKLVRKTDPVLYYEYDFPKTGQMTVIISLGSWPDTAADIYQTQGLFSEAYAVECLCLELLSCSYKLLKEIVYREKRCFLEQMQFCREEDLNDLITTLKMRWGSFPVSVNEANAILPSKTVVFYGKLGMQGQNCEHICQNCSHTDCCFRDTAAILKNNQENQSL